MSIARPGALGRLIQRLDLHSDLSDEERGALLALPGQVRSVRARADFVHAGEETEHACLVASGIVGRFAQQEDGSRQVVSLHIPGDMVDIYSLLLPRATTPLAAVSAAEVVQVPHAALRELIARHPGLGTALWRDTAVDGATLVQAAVNLGRRNARARVAHLLCEMAVRFGRIGAVRDGGFAFPVTQEQLGDVLALTPVHVNRTLRALREEGLARFAAGRVEVLDWPALRGAAGFEGSYLCSAGEALPPPSVLRA